MNWKRLFCSHRRHGSMKDSLTSPRWAIFATYGSICTQFTPLGNACISQRLYKLLKYLEEKINHDLILYGIRVAV